METRVTIVDTVTDIDGISYDLVKKSFDPNRPQHRLFGIRYYTEDESSFNDFAKFEDALKSFEDIKSYIADEFKDAE